MHVARNNLSRAKVASSSKKFGKACSTSFSSTRHIFMFGYSNADEIKQLTYLLPVGNRVSLSARILANLCLF